jgi:uncharacterized membrane-anchored protein
MRGPATRAMLAGTFCLAVLAGMLVIHAWPLWTGRTIYLRVESASARDALQTGLVTLEYAFDVVCVAPGDCAEPEGRSDNRQAGPAMDLPARGAWADALAADSGPDRRRWNDRILYLQVDMSPTGLEHPTTVATPLSVTDSPEPSAIALRGRLRQALSYPRVTLDLGLEAIYLTRGATPAIEAAVKAGTPIYAEVAVASNGQARVRALIVDGRRYE